MSNEPRYAQESFDIVTRLMDIMSLSDIDLILQKTISELTDLTGASNCSIYLVPDLLKNFNGKLLRGDQIVDYETVEKSFVILAATNQEEIKQWINKAFYVAEEGITGWVYEHKIPLNIKNIWDQKDLYSISNTLNAQDIYGEDKEDLSDYKKKSLLAMPLYTNERSLGVLKISGKRPHFTEFDKKVATQGSMIISRALYNAAEFSRQKNSILGLIEVGAKRDFNEIILEASVGLRNILYGEKSQIYIPTDNTNQSLSLWIENGKRIHVEKKWKRGDDFVGWVYKTGKPLIIEDIRNFNEPTDLNDKLLVEISDSPLVDSSDRNIQRQEPFSIPQNNLPITFLAVPIIQDNEVLGVISVQSRYGRSYPRSVPFNREDLQLIDSIARIISNSIESDKQKILSELFTEMGFTNELEKLSAIVVQMLPKIVSSAGCSIFEYTQGIHGKRLVLVSTTSHTQTGADLSYELGEGKTGFCGLSKSTLVVNHFGAGDLSETRMDYELERIRREHPEDVIERLLDENGVQVGILQLRNGAKCTEEIKDKFKQLAKSQIHITNKLPTFKDSYTSSLEHESSWSLAAIPIQNNNDLLGVITIGRPVPQNPFSTHDIVVIEAIAGRLATVLGNIRLQEQRQELFISLAHEINTPLTGILAESENLLYELRGQDELAVLARENLEQVLRLHLVTETTMGVLSTGEIVREFSFSNIGNVLRNACSTFKAEAIHKGCDILEPKSVDGNFPEIEMSELNLLLAFKNIIHNAVKYSFTPPLNQEKKREIKVWGGYTDSTKKYYRVNIQNYGIGISQEDVESRKIFEKYYRGSNAGDRRRTGAGFGLAYARRMIEDLHGGKIEVVSVPLTGSGHLTTFSVILPITRKQS